MKHTSIKFPEMRRDLEMFLQRLGDPEFQKRAWLKDEGPWGFPRMDDIVHFLFDDTHLSCDPMGCVGKILVDVREAAAIRAVTEGIDAMVERHGWMERDAEYVALPEWGGVVQAARVAHELVVANGVME